MNNKQPKALSLLFSVQMWECFSYYGMRALLLLYLVEQLGFADKYAYGVYALYGALTEFGGIFGGLLADKLLGLRAAIALGGFIMMGGHLCMALGDHSAFLFAGLALIIVGSGLFSSNISALLGLFYGPEDDRREEGFTLFYVGINLGALLATILCGWVGETYGWHYGFGLAAGGLLIGLTAFFLFASVLEDKGCAPRRIRKREVTGLTLGLGIVTLAVVGVLTLEHIFLGLIVPVCILLVGYTLAQLWWDKTLSIRNMILFLLFLGALVVFYAAEDQAASSLIIFNERHGTGTIGNLEIPTSWLLGLNPLVILVGGYLIAHYLKRGKKGDSLQPVVLALLASSGAYAGLAYYLGIHTEAAPTLAIMEVILILSLAELFIGPAFYAFCSHAASEKHQGMMMGLVPMGFALAAALSGHMNKSMALEDAAEMGSVFLFTQGFYKIALYLLLAAVVVAVGFWLLKVARPSRPAVHSG